MPAGAGSRGLRETSGSSHVAFGGRRQSSYRVGVGGRRSGAGALMGVPEQHAPLVPGVGYIATAGPATLPATTAPSTGAFRARTGDVIPLPLR